MKRRFTTEKARHVVLQSSGSEPQDSSSDQTAESASDGESDSESAAELRSTSPDSCPQSGDEPADPADVGGGWTARSGCIWSPSHEKTEPYLPAARGMVSGPTRFATARIHDIESSFDIFFTADIIGTIVEMTNLRGKREVENWTDIDSTDVRAYIGLLILAGVYKSKGESSSGLWDEQTGRAIFRAAMSHKKFKGINSNIRFDDKLSRRRRRDDRLAPIRSLWEKWTARLPMLFNPGDDICVDEQLLAFKGCCKFRQYVPSKPGKYGLKIWVTVDVATTYAWRCQICTGKAGDSAAEVGERKRVVLEMTAGLQGVTVTCDYLFTSYPLMQELLGRKVALVGTARKNKPELPPVMLQTKGRAVLSSLFAFTENTAAVSYIARRGKNVIVLSSKHREPAVTEDERRTPVMITDYSRCRRGVDDLDKACLLYLSILTEFMCLCRYARYILIFYHSAGIFQALTVYKD